MRAVQIRCDSCNYRIASHTTVNGETTLENDDPIVMVGVELEDGTALEFCSQNCVGIYFTSRE